MSTTAEDSPAPASEPADRLRRGRAQTLRELYRSYRTPPSFAQRLPWVDYESDSQTLLLEDGISRAAVLELTPVACDARPEAYLEELAGKLHTALVHALPEEEPPWILQFYLQREPVAREWRARLAGHVEPVLADDPYTRAYLATLGAHLDQLARPGGVFDDGVVAGGRWRVASHTLRVVLYRRLHRYYRSPLGLTPAQELRVATERLMESLSAAGVGARRLTCAEFLRWMARWFNPAPRIPGADPERLADWIDYPDDHAERPFGADLGEALILGLPRSDAANGVWNFDERAHTVVTVEKLLKRPVIGHLSAERAIGARLASLWDRLPDSTVLAMTLVIRPQDQIVDRIERLESRALGSSAEAARARTDYERARVEIAAGNKLYPMAFALYLSAATVEELCRDEDRLNALLLAEGLKPITRDTDPIRLDAYLRFLPANFDPAADRLARWTRLQYTDHLARLLPLYGRSRGTGRPGVFAFNRGGEPFTFDPLASRDRRKNGHMLIIGPTGSGKSAFLLATLAHQIAMHRPRIFLTEVGRSFELFGQHLERLGVSVNRLTLTPSEDVRFPIFHEALGLTDDDLEKTELSADERAWHEAEDGEPASLTRDVLAEMEVAAALMVTGGETREIERMKRADRRLLQRAIIDAGSEARRLGRETVLTEDVARALKALDGLDGSRRERALDMADCIEMYTQGFAGQVFNRHGAGWPDADVTILNLGLFAGEGYEDKIALSVIGLVNHVNALAERQRYDERQTILCFDEAHLVTTHPLLAPYLSKASKVWGRRYAVWLWLATQNMGDFPAGAKRILGMLEWWVALYMPQEEIDQLVRFRELTDEQRSLLQAVRKEPGKYTEGVLLRDESVALFRSVPPPELLALAQTEKSERAGRARLMQEHGISELEAADRIADRIRASRETPTEDQER